MIRILSVGKIEDFSKSVIPKQSKKNRKIVESILADVKKNGDLAVKKYEKKFSKSEIKTLRVSKSEIKNAYSTVTKKQITAIKLAKKNLSFTESKIKQQLCGFDEKINGIKISKKFISIPSVGCYVPGGLARYPTSAVMSVIPAKIAGVRRIVVVSPPNSEGKIDPLTLVSADLCGATEIYKTGGAQSIAALSFGTKSISPVSKIVGPGGYFVSMAKSLVSEHTSIDMIAGPTELAILADEFASPDLIADDLISQAEHSSDTFCYVITTSIKLASQIKKSLEKKITNISRRKIVQKSLQKNGFIAICKNLKNAISLINEMSPEHLEIMTKNPSKVAKSTTNCGLVLIGKNSPSSASDYLLGSNHILPTNTFGKSRGSLSVLDFLKLYTKIESSKNHLKEIAGAMEILTSTESLTNHFEAVKSRLS